MKERITRLSVGIEEYSIPVIETSVTSQEHQVEAGEKTTGSFNVYTASEYELRGLVYSDRDFIRIRTTQFVGNRCEITYEIDAFSYDPGDLLKGRIHLVSNCGEAFVEIEAEVIGRHITSSMGELSDLFQFVNLVRNSYEEALKIFCSPEFTEVFLKDRLNEVCMYQGCIQGHDRKRALEEFLIGIHKKEKVTISFSSGREKEKRTYQSLEAPYGDTLTLLAGTWGYQDIQVTVDGDFITDYKDNITTEEFMGNQYQFSYVIAPERLHPGRNFGRIRFTTISGTLECQIEVKLQEHMDYHTKEFQKCVYGLTQKYLEFRMKKMGVEQWAEESITLVERARGLDDSQIFLRLYEAQVELSGKRSMDAEWLLDSASECILRKQDTELEVFCYYLYIRSLQKKDPGFTKTALHKIQGCYQTRPHSWRLLWLLLYMDSSFENNKSLKLIRMKEQCMRGCNSPLIYYEALCVFNQQPGLLRILNQFELQVLSFGSRYDAIDLGLGIRLAELALVEKQFHPLLYRILTAIYEKYENEVILEAVLCLLIRGKKNTEAYFHWYASGVKADLKINGLFENYMRSMPENYTGEIPETIFMYYASGGSGLGEKESVFYHYIIRNQEKHPDIYKKYLYNMEQFALDHFRTGDMDEHLAAIYQKLLSPGYITEDNRTSLVPLLHQWRIQCENPAIQKVIVLHKELEEEHTYRVKQGVAYVEIYTEDSILLFEDCYGRRYLHSVPYTTRRMLESKPMEQTCMEQNQENAYVMAELCQQALKYHKKLPKGIRIFKDVLRRKEFRKEYQRDILRSIIEAYMQLEDGEEIDRFFKEIDLSSLKREYRNKVVEIMIMRGLYGEAGKYLQTYGICGIDPRMILKYATRKVEEHQAQQDALTYACYYAFSHGKYNRLSLEYLQKYYQGDTKTMYAIWDATEGYTEETRELEERMIGQILFSRVLFSHLPEVFASYLQRAAAPMLKKAYFYTMSYAYFVKENHVNKEFFRHLEQSFLRGEFSQESVDTALWECAYLKYCDKHGKISRETLGLCRRFVYALTKRGIYFNFFKRFRDWFLLPGELIDKTVIEYRSDTKEQVFIHFQLEKHFKIDGIKQQPCDTDTEYHRVEMDQVFRGMFIKSFMLFYGENVKYYIGEGQETAQNFTESSCHYIEDVSVETGDTRYGMVNDMLQCMELHEEGLVLELMETYYKKKYMTEALFK